MLLECISLTAFVLTCTFMVRLVCITSQLPCLESKEYVRYNCTRLSASCFVNHVFSLTKESFLVLGVGSLILRGRMKDKSMEVATKHLTLGNASCSEQFRTEFKVNPGCIMQPKNSSRRPF